MNDNYKRNLLIAIIFLIIFVTTSITFLVITLVSQELYIWLLLGLIFLAMAIIFGIYLFFQVLHDRFLRCKEIDKQYSHIYELNKELELARDQIESTNNLAITESKNCHMVFNHIEDIIVSYDQTYTILMNNKEFEKILEVEVDECIGKNMLELFNKDAEKNDIQYLTNQAIESQCAIRDEVRIFHTNIGERFYNCVVTPIMNDEYVIENFIVIGRDITDTKKHAEHVHRLIYYDYLTKLPNRDMLLEDLGLYLEEAEYTKKRSAVICIGLDEFKKLNDTFGHNRGDLILKAVSKRLEKLAGRKYKLYRIGGDEFSILVKNSAKGEEMLRILSQINIIFNESIIVEGNSLYISASIGIAIQGLHGNDANTLISNADTAMNSVKRTGIEKHAYFDEHMKVNISKNVQIENAIRDSIVRNELYLNYQPQIDSGNGEIRGYEALLRWKHSELGFVSPNDFIPILESTHQIIPIGLWVLKKAIEFHSKVNNISDHDLVISVNISAVQLMQNNFVEMVQGVLTESGMNPELLELEITESHVMDALTMVNMKLKALQDIGVKIALDDFGTGYSSLNYLRKLNCDVLKIDKLFVDDLIDDEKDVDVILGAIIALAKELGFEIIAEGVEVAKQIEVLTKMKCDFFQGYYFSRPLDEEKVLQIGRDAEYKELLNKTKIK